METQKTDISKLSFEQALQELEVLVRKMEEGRLPLEEAITSYERGVALKNYCEGKLREAKLRVDQITISPEGVVGTEPFAAV
jgi:exodeoxyribonuclease VII small subunit